MSTTPTTSVVLEPAAQAFADATADPPYLYDLGPIEGRKLVDETQAGEIFKPPVEDEWISVPGGPSGDVRVRIVRPHGATGTLPVVLYIHGAGWVFGNIPIIRNNFSLVTIGIVIVSVLPMVFELVAHRRRSG